MKYIIVFRCTRSGAECTCEAFPFDGCSAEQSLVSCINYHVSAGYSLVSISTAPLVGDELPDEEAYDCDETTVHDFILE